MVGTPQGVWGWLPSGVAPGLGGGGVAPAGLGEALDEALLGLGLRDLREVRVGDEAPARRRGLGLADRHYRSASRPWKIGIESPARTCTTAFFHSRVRPEVNPRRFGLDGTVEVRTSTTVTSKSCSIDCLICVLCASLCTRNVYLSAVAST